MHFNINDKSQNKDKQIKTNKNKDKCAGLSSIHDFLHSVHNWSAIHTKCGHKIP